LAFAFASPKYGYDEEFMPRKIDSTPRLKGLFKDTKLLCFGRYAIEVPKEALLVLGDASFPSPIRLVTDSPKTPREMAEEDMTELVRKNNTAEVHLSTAGEFHDSWKISYFENGSAKKYGLKIYKTFRKIGRYTFILTNSLRMGERETDALARDASRIRNLSVREEEGVPVDPGYCIEKGFIASDRYSGQEMVSAGIYFPTFPDVQFFVRSNKDAYADYPKEDFEKMKSGLSLLVRIRKAQELQGKFYPSRTVLREGKRAVQHWKGEESLIKREDGTHDFEWSLVGTPMDVAYPSVYEVGMFTKVAHNSVGAAEKASLTDDEAIALWDKLLSGLKFRVKVPGAPEGSYYFIPGAKTDGGAKP
jgi:Tle cognate immunity protein 4 C-terminal domain/Tle cognate immunity protein 4 N-terminal domain